MILPTFKTWAAFLTSPDAIDIPETDHWEQVLTADMSSTDTIGLLTQESDYITMSVAPVTKDLQFFHHCTTIGGSRIKKDQKFFVALQGFGAMAIPVVIDTDAITKETQVKCPKSTDVIEYSTVDAVMVARAAKCKVFNTKPVVLLPPVLGEVVTSLTSQAPADVYVAMLKHLRSLDTDTLLLFDNSVGNGTPLEEGDEDLPLRPKGYLCKDLACIFRWLWSAAHDNIPCVQSVMASPNLHKIHTWSSHLHSMHISAPPPEENEGSSKAMQDLSSSVQALSQATQMSLTQPTGTHTTTTKHSFEKFPEAVQQMILFGGSPDAENPLSGPPLRLQELLACKNSTTAKQFLAHVLQKEYRCLTVVPQSLAMSVYQGCLLWDNRSIPSNFSIFYLGEPTTKGDSHSKTLMYHMKITEGKGLTQSDFDDAIKSSYHFPQNAHELQTQIQNFIGLLSVICGPRSYIVSQLYTWDTHIHDNFIMYKIGS